MSLSVSHPELILRSPVEEIASMKAVPNPGHTSDISLPAVEFYVTELQAGVDREENFQKIFQRYFSVIVRFFMKRGFSREECQDLAQDVFLRVFRSIDSYRSDGPFEGWLFQVAANVYRNRLRDQQAVKRQAPEDSLESFSEEVSKIADQDHVLGVAGPAGPDQAYLEKERVEIFDQALAELPEQMRRCLMLRIHRELKYREIATIMQISIETVKAHLYQARNRLKSKLDGYFDEIDEREA